MPPTPIPKNRGCRLSSRLASPRRLLHLLLVAQKLGQILVFEVDAASVLQANVGQVGRQPHLRGRGADGAVRVLETLEDFHHLRHGRRLRHVAWIVEEDGHLQAVLVGCALRRRALTWPPSLKMMFD